MADGRTPFQAVERLVDPLQQAVSCLSRAIFTYPGSTLQVGGLIDVLLNRGEPVRLRGRERIHLRVRMRVRVRQAEPPRGLWDAAMAAHEYRLSDRDDREILAYHWHPGGQSHAEAPHLHLGAGAEIGRTELLTAHLPTGSVAIQGVLRLAVESFGVEPVRRDWDRVLGEWRVASSEWRVASSE